MPATTLLAAMKRDDGFMMANWSPASARERERKKKSYPQVAKLADITTKRPVIEANQHIIDYKVHLSQKALLASLEGKEPETITIKQQYIQTYSNGQTIVNHRTIEVKGEQAEKTHLKIDDVFKAARLQYSHIPKTQMVGARRSRSVCYPRHILIFLCAMHTTRSLPEIGRRFGGRDHSTVIYARDEVAKRILPGHHKFHKETYNSVKALENVLQPELYGGKRTIPVEGES